MGYAHKKGAVLTLISETRAVAARGLAEFDCDGFRMLALRALECAQIMTRRALRFDTSEPHLCPAFRAVGPVNRLLRWR
jgi:hypothetical protein